MNTETFAPFETQSMYGTTTYRVKQLAPECFVCEFVTYVPHVPPTPEELVEQAVESQLYEEMLSARDGNEPYVYYPHGHWRTPEAAKRACELLEAIEAAADGVRAFGAPSECMRDACSPKQREFDKLEAEFSAPAPERKPRVPTVAETLPNGGRGMSDDDIIAALGERGLSFVRPIEG